MPLAAAPLQWTGSERLLDALGVVGQPVAMGQGNGIGVSVRLGAIELFGQSLPSDLCLLAAFLGCSLGRERLLGANIRQLLGGSSLAPLPRPEDESGQKEEQRQGRQGR